MFMVESNATDLHLLSKSLKKYINYKLVNLCFSIMKENYQPFSLLK